MKNALTFDIEDYFHVSAFSGSLDKDHWRNMPSRVEATTDKILSLLNEAGCQATFFILGWVARSQPQIVRRIAEGGHEVACHSLEHRRVYEMTPVEFLEDTRTAKLSLEDASGKQVVGYRAPSFSITRDSFWAFEILADLGFRYDSSVFPIKHPNYGFPEAPRSPFLVETKSGLITEFPMTTLEFGRRRSPIGGGAYFRILPYWYTRWGLRHINRTEGRPVCLYLHPWELDPEQPRISAGLTSRMRHYLGLRGVETKVRKLLHDFEFQPLFSLIEGIKIDASCSAQNYATKTAGMWTAYVKSPQQ